MTTTDDHFSPDHAMTDRRTSHTSPSGKYVLTITPYATKPGCWNYTLGAVATIDGAPIAEVQRNYSDFPYLFVEGHPNGHDYLVCGADYQGQTVIELDTGKRRDTLSNGSDKGFGFCWSQYRFDPLTKAMIVCGCYWAAPYEYKFFDFADPMAGWPEFESADICIDADDRWPEVQTDGTIKCFQSERRDDDDETDEPTPIAASMTFKLVDHTLAILEEFVSENEKKSRNHTLVIIEEFVSEKEKEARIKNEEARRKYDEWLANMRATHPIYLKAKELAEQAPFSPGKHDSVGWTYPGWCLGFHADERRVCRRIVTTKPFSVDLEWAFDTGPIKVVIYKDGKHVEDRFFPHSVESMIEAFAYVRSIIDMPS